MPMMCLLICDIAKNAFSIGFADAERRIPTLPGECTLQDPFLMNPFRGISFHPLNNLGERQFRRKAKNHVSVVRDAVDMQRFAFKLAQKSSHIREDLIAAVLRQVRYPFLRAEDDVYDQSIPQL